MGTLSRRSQGHGAALSFRFTIARLCCRPRIHKGCGVDQIVGDDPEPDPSSHAVGTMVATAPESMSAFNHADATFTSDAPALTAPEPGLAFIRASRRRLRPSPRQDHSSDATVDGGFFIASRCESAITCGQV